MSIEITANDLASVYGISLDSSDKKPLSPDLLLSGVSTDSREIQEGNIFFARKGELSDGHKYLEQAVNLGAKALVVDRVEAKDNKFLLASQRASRKASREASQNACQGVSTEFEVFEVENVDDALQKLAKYWRNKITAPVIGITGSNGKTTTKEILKTILEKTIGPGTANQKSYNNHVGVPLTILSAPLDTSWMTLEMGMNHPGELTELGKIAQPDIVLILNVGAAHLGHFESISEIADAKAELVSALGKDGILVTPSFDPELTSALKKLKNEIVFSKNHFQFSSDTLLETKKGEAEKGLLISNIVDEGLDGASFDLQVSSSLSSEDKKYSCKIPLLGKHNVYNGAAAILSAKLAFKDVSFKSLVESCLELKPADMRLDVERLENLTILNDCYNANPVSMKSALDFLNSLREPKIIVFGEMAELGDEAKGFHIELLENALDLNPELQICIWPNFIELSSLKPKNKSTELLFLEQKDVAAKVIEKLNKIRCSGGGNPIVLLKGSRTAKLENVIEEIKKEIT